MKLKREKKMKIKRLIRIKYVVVPLTLLQANTLVSTLHRHHKKCTGHRFSIGAKRLDTGEIVGAAICGRPVSQFGTDFNKVLEVSRLVTNGSFNACSFLYGASARIAKEMGFNSIQTFILERERGSTLKACGWEFVHVSPGNPWTSRKGRIRNEITDSKKKKYRKVFRHD